MLSQRVAKLALLAALPPDGAADIARSRIAPAIEEFDASLQYLVSIPLVTQETGGLLANARTEWSTVVANIDGGGSPDGRLALAGASEALLATFDRLTAIYERSMAVLTDPQAVG